MYTIVEAMPTTAKLVICSGSSPEAARRTPPFGPPGADPRSWGTLIVPRANPLPSRTMPRRSASAVATTSTRESRSSIQSTGIS